MSIDWKDHRTDRTDGQELRLMVQRRLQRVLRLLSDRIESIAVTVTDVNGPRGGIDKYARIQINGPPFRQIIATAMGPTVHSALGNAVLRARTAAVRAIQRRRSRRARPTTDSRSVAG